MRAGGNQKISKDGEYLIEDNKTLEIIGNIYDKEDTNNG